MKKWNESDVEKLFSLVSRGCFVQEIADSLQRTPKAVKEKMKKLKLMANKPTMNETIECKTCGVSFVHRMSEQRKYCSQRCSAVFNNKLYIKRPKKEVCLEGFKPEVLKPAKHCLECNTGLKYQSKFCSNKCQNDFQMNEKIASGEFSFRTARHWLIKQDRKCSVCNTATWNEKPVPLEIDHINGDPTDNSISNLRLICPNCHAQTPTYKGRNKGNGRHSRRERYTQGKSY